MPLHCETCKRKSDRLMQAYRPEADGAFECKPCALLPAEEARMNNEQREHYGLKLREEGEE